MDRNVYQPTSYWEAYRPYQPKTYRGWITEPKPYHSVRELEMDRISKDRHLKEFFKKREEKRKAREAVEVSKPKVKFTGDQDIPKSEPVKSKILGNDSVNGYADLDKKLGKSNSHVASEPIKPATDSVDGPPAVNDDALDIPVEEQEEVVKEEQNGTAEDHQDINPDPEPVDNEPLENIVVEPEQPLEPIKSEDHPSESTTEAAVVDQSEVTAKPEQQQQEMQDQKDPAEQEPQLQVEQQQQDEMSEPNQEAEQQQETLQQQDSIVEQAEVQNEKPEVESQPPEVEQQKEEVAELPVEADQPQTEKETATNEVVEEEQDNDVEQQTEVEPEQNKEVKEQAEVQTLQEDIPVDENQSQQTMTIEEVTAEVPDPEIQNPGEQLATFTSETTNQKLVDERDLGNDELIRTEYEVENITVEE